MPPPARLLQPTAWRNGLGGAERVTLHLDLLDADPSIAGCDQDARLAHVCDGAGGGIGGLLKSLRGEDPYIRIVGPAVGRTPG